MRGEKTMIRRLEEIRKAMQDAGYYSKKEIEEICNIEKSYIEECEQISEQCIAEGYPSHGENYEIRCSEARKKYDEYIALFD